MSNDGLNTTSTGGWEDGVYLTTNPVFNIRNDTQIFTAVHQGALDVGASYTNAVSLPLPANVTGVFHLYVYADTGGAVYEGPYTNGNYGPRTNLITITNLPSGLYPDIQVTNLTFSSPAVAGSPRSFSWTVINRGELSTPLGTNWVDSLYLSTDGTLNPGKFILLGNYANPTLLIPGDSYTQSKQVTIPACDVGDYFIVVATDSGNDVYEGPSGHTDSVTSSASELTVLPSQLARLTVSSVSIPSTGTAGQHAEFSWTVANSGETVAEGPWEDDVYLSPNSVLDSQALLVAAVAIPGPLGVGASYTSNINITIPPCASGPLYAIVATDTGDVVNTASCETHNSTASTGTIAVTATIYPNLQAISVKVPTNIASGESFQVTYAISNAGTGPATGTWVDAIDIGTNGSFGSNTVIFGTVTNTTTIPAHGVYTNTVDVVAPQCISGAYYVCVMSDADYQVNSPVCSPDSAECTPTQVILTYPNLQFVNVSKPATAVGGSPFSVSWMVNNTGNGVATGTWVDIVYASLNANLSTDFELASYALPLATNIITGPLAPGSNYTQSASVTLPPTDGGNYSIYFVTDASNIFQACGSSADNIAESQMPVAVEPSLYPDLAVTAATIPMTAVAGQPMTVSWTVKNVGTYTTGSASWYDEIYLSLNQFIDPNVHRHRDVRQSGPPGSGRELHQHRADDHPSRHRRPILCDRASQSEWRFERIRRDGQRHLRSGLSDDD